jgi:copper chaperone CopZ
MNRAAAILGVLAVGGGLAICDLCSTNAASARGSGHELIGVANATVPGGAEAPRDYDAARSSTVPVPAKKLVAFKITGMTCGGCVFAVRKVITRLPGVSKADVSYEKSRALVTYDPKFVTTTQIIAAIKTLGYSATVDASSASP